MKRQFGFEEAQQDQNSPLSPNVFDEYQRAQSLYAAGRYADSFKLFERTATSGFGLGLCCLARAYEFGHGVETNIGEALNCYVKAVQQKSLEGHYRLGAYLYSGYRVSKRNVTGAKHLQHAAAHGHLLAEATCLYYGIGVAQDLESAARYYHIAADRDSDYIAQNNLACCYQEGLGVQEDLRKAINYFRLSAEQGFAAGYHGLGLSYLGWDEGSPKMDPRMGLSFLHIAADTGEGLPWSALQLANIYADGLDTVPSDIELSRHYQAISDRSRHEILYDISALGATPVPKAVIPPKQPDSD